MTSFIAALSADERADVGRRVRAVGTTFGSALVLRYACEAYLLTPR